MKVKNTLFVLTKREEGRSKIKTRRRRGNWYGRSEVKRTDKGNRPVFGRSRLTARVEALSIAL
jgi:hypothetical protein